MGAVACNKVAGLGEDHPDGLPISLGEKMDNKDIKISLLYNLDEVNVLLTLLSSLPFNQSAQMIASIRDQALPQLPIVTEQQKGID